MTKRLAQIISDQPFTLVLGASGTGKSSLVKAGLMPVLKGDAPLNPDVEGSTSLKSNDKTEEQFVLDPQEWHVLDPMRPTDSPLDSLKVILEAGDISLAAPKSSEGEAISRGSFWQRLTGRGLQANESDQVAAEQLTRTIRQWCENSDKKLLLIIDQFEEVITLCQDDDERTQFVKLLVDLITTFPEQLRLVLTLRSDFEPQIQSLLEQVAEVKLVTVDSQADERPVETPAPPVLTDPQEVETEETQPNPDEPQTQGPAPAVNLEANQSKIPPGAGERNQNSKIALARFIVPPMNRNELREVIEGPASVKVIFFDPLELVDTLIEEVIQTPGALPLLSFTLSQMYLKYFEDQSDSRALTEAYYKKLGGVIGSLRKRADEEYKKLAVDFKEEGPAYQATMRRVMVRMVALEGGEATRRRIPRTELKYADEAETERADEVIRRLEEARLLSSDAIEGEAYLEPAHDALVRAWDKLSVWVSEVKEHLPLQRRLTTAANLWHEASKKKIKQGLLWHNHPWLPQVEELLARVDHKLIKMGRLARLWRSTRGIFSRTKVQAVDKYWLNGLELDFVQCSVSKKRRRRRLGYTFGITLYFVLSGLLGFAVTSCQEAEDQANITRVGHIAAQSEAAPENQTSQSLLLAVEALSRTQTIEQHLAAPTQALYEAVQRPLGLPIPTLSGNVSTTAFSPAGLWAVIGTEAGDVWLSNNPENEPIPLASHTDRVNVAVFSPDGLWLVTGSDDGLAHLWSVNDLEINPHGAEPWILSHNDGVLDAAFSPDGQKLITGSIDGTVWAWSLENPDAESELLFDSDGSAIEAVTVRTDGTFVIAGYEDNMVWVWPEDQTEPWKESIDSAIGMIDLDPNGQWLLVADDGDLVALVSLDYLESEPQLLGLKNNVTSTAFSGDGTWLATGSFDGTIWLWFLESPQVPFAVLGHGSPIRSVAFDAEGTNLMTSGDDGLTRLWPVNNPEISPSVLLGHEDWVRDLAFSSDGNQLVTASEDGTVRLWSSFNSIPPESQILTYQEDWVTGVAFSPDGKWLIFVSADGVINRRETAQPNVEFEPLLQEEGINSLDLSPDGKWLAVGSYEGTTSLWSPDSLKLAHTLPGVGGTIWDVTFSPDSQWLATGNDEGTVQLWATDDLEAEPKSLQHDHWVGALAFSDNGRFLAVGLGQGTIELWSISEEENGPKLLQSWPVGNEQPIRAITFSPNGEWLFSGGEDNTAKQWQIDGSEDPPIILESDPIILKHQKNVLALALSPDERYLATGSADGRVQLWPTDLAELTGIACTFAGRNLTQTEWENYFPEEPYQQTCLEWPIYPNVEE